MPAWIPPAMLYPLAVEDEAPVDEEPIKPVSAVTGQDLHLIAAFRSDILIRIKDQQPFVAYGQRVHRPVLLLCVTFELMLNDSGAHVSCDSHRAIRAERIDDEYLVGPAHHAAKAL